MDHYLSDSELSSYKTRLVNGKAQLEAEIAAIDEEMKDMRDTHSDPLDAAQTIGERNNALAQLNQKKGSLVNYVYAIKNFDDYGYCIECGEEIGKDRLDIAVESTKCIECKSKAEHIFRTQKGSF